MSEPCVVGAWLDAAARRARVVGALEAAALGLAGALAVIVAAVVSGASPFETPTFGVAAIGAAACAAIWFRERQRTRGELARRADRRLAQQGALVTAFESEARDAAAPFARSLGARVAAALSAHALSRAIPWPSPAFAAAPMIAAAVLALALERSPRMTQEQAELLGRVAVGLELAARSSAGDAGSSDAAERVLVTAGALARAAETRTVAREQVARELAAVDRALSELAQRANSGAVEIRSARDLTAAALARVGASSAGGAGGGSRSLPNASDSGAPAVANGSAPRTMMGHAEPAQSPMSVSQPSEPPRLPSAGEVGTTAGRWWPARYDAIVTAFLEAAPAQR